MRVFVTGASGYVGHSVAKAFRAKGHTVYGMVRSEEDARALSLDEIWPVMGDLSDPNSYRSILEDIEVAVHCAFDYSNKGVENDAKTIETITSTFSKSPLSRSFIYTSGVWIYGSMGYTMVDESMPTNPIDIAKWRPAHEEKVLKAATANCRTVVMRPGCLYGGIGGLTDLLFSKIQDGTVIIPGDGSNRWPMIHHQDLAHAYVSVAEQELSRVILNVVDDSTATLREMAEAIARAAGFEGKVTTKSLEESQAIFGYVTEGLLIDLTVNNSRIKRLLGWQIHHAPFIYDIDLYYNAWQNAQEGQEF